MKPAFFFDGRFFYGLNQILLLASMIEKKLLYQMGFITLFGFSAVGIALAEYLQDRSPFEFFNFKWAWYWQLLLGLVYGTACGFLARWVIKIKWMNTELGRYKVLIEQFNLTTGEVLFLSLCAGIGEEILFRGAIQHWLGIWITSVLFVAIHGYLNPKDFKVFLYGLVMTAMIIGISYMYEYTGLISAMAAHFMIDVVLLFYLKNGRAENTQAYEIDQDQSLD